MNRIIMILFFCLAFTTVKAQFYIGLNAGYGMGINGRSLGDFLLSDVVSQNEIYATNKISAFGGGFRIAPSFGYKINDKIGCEINVGYHSTNKVTGQVDFMSTPIDITNVSMKGKMVFISPSLIGVIYDQFPNIYVRLGGIYSLGNFKFNYESLSGNSSTESVTVLSGGSALGLIFCLGGEWRVKKNWSIKSELFYTNANYYPKTAEAISLKEDGLDVLDRIPLENRITNYSKSGNSDGEYFGSALQSGTVLRPQIPMNGFGLSVGLIYTFTKKE